MALCVRRPEIIKVIMEMSCRDGADVVAKAVKANMPKLAKAASVKYGMSRYRSSKTLHCSIQTHQLIISISRQVLQASPLKLLI
jgi:hypothetical protein